MTEEELQAIEQRADEARPEPWRVDWPGRETGEGRGHIIGGDGLKLAETLCPCLAAGWANAAFIAAARTDVPALIAEIRRLKREQAEE